MIALYTKDDCFCLVLESEEDLEDWLKSLLSLQQGEDVPEGELPKPMYGKQNFFFNTELLVLVKLTKSHGIQFFTNSLLRVAIFTD